MGITKKDLENIKEMVTLYQRLKEINKNLCQLDIKGESNTSQYRDYIILVKAIRDLEKSHLDNMHITAEKAILLNDYLKDNHFDFLDEYYLARLLSNLNYYICPRLDDHTIKINQDHDLVSREDIIYFNLNYELNDIFIYECQQVIKNSKFSRCRNFLLKYLYTWAFTDVNVEKRLIDSCFAFQEPARVMNNYLLLYGYEKANIKKIKDLVGNDALDLLNNLLKRDFKNISEKKQATLDMIIIIAKFSLDDLYVKDGNNSNDCSFKDEIVKQICMRSKDNLCKKEKIKETN